MDASSDDERNNYEDSPKTPYNGENINDSSNDEGNNDEVVPDPPTNDVNIKDNSDDGKNYYEVTPDTPTKMEMMKRLRALFTLPIWKISARRSNKSALEPQIGSSQNHPEKLFNLIY